MHSCFVIIHIPNIEVCEIYLAILKGWELVCTNLEHIIKSAHRNCYSVINFHGFLVSFRNVLLTVRMYN
jgi:hypothetical protein